MWIVPLSRVFDSHGLHWMVPFAFAATSLAAFISPLIFGAMADRHASAVKVLRALSVATAVAMAMASTAIKLHWSPWVTLALLQLHALCYSPTFGISAAIAFSRLSDPRTEFGPLRAMATLGWMAGCWLVSALGADTSPVAGYAAAVLWLLVATFTFLLPVSDQLKSPGALSWRERLGLDALTLLKHPDHRVVFVTAALFCIPMAAFYPYAPAHLRELGFERTSAWMSLGQITEIIAMFSLGALLLRWRLKWIFALGLGFGLFRFLFSAFNTKTWLLTGIVLHGCSYTLVLITGQIYLDQRVEPAWRARAQALMTLMNGGMGNLLGYLGTGWWFHACNRASGARWPIFWGGLTFAVGLVLLYFLKAYHGIGAGFLRSREKPGVAVARE